MQLESHYDAILIGHNYLSTLGALMMKRSGKKVLIIRDPNVHVGENYFFHFSLLEENFLKAWDRFNGLGLEDFWPLALTSEKLFLGWKRAWMNLGHESPFLNLLELQRKVPDLLHLESNVSAQVFDHDFFHYSQEIANKWAESLILKNIETLTDTISCPDHLKVTIDKAYDHYLSLVKNENSILHFNLFLQSVLGSRLQYPLHKVQFTFLLLKLFSPRRKFLTSTLPDLENRLRAQDILVKEARVESWQTKGAGGSLLLDSYDGVVHSKKIIVMGEFGHESPLTLIENDRQANLLSCIQFTFDLPIDLGSFTLVDGEEAHNGFSSVLKVFKDQSGRWKGIDYIKDESGDKPSFHEQNLRLRLEHLFHRYFPGIKPPQHLKISYGVEKKILFLDFERSQPMKETSLKKDALLLIEETSPGKKREAFGIQYWGSLKSNSLGLFSLLLSTKLSFTETK
jgi:hypothetical protein